MEDFKCVKDQSCLHCGSNYCRFVDELDQLKAENEIWKNQVLILDGEDVTVQVTQEQFEEYNNLKAAKQQAEQKLEKIHKLLTTCKKNFDVPCELCEYSEQCEKEDTDTQILKIIDEVE